MFRVISVRVLCSFSVQKYSKHSCFTNASIHTLVMAELPSTAPTRLKSTQARTEMCCCLPAGGGGPLAGLLSICGLQEGVHPHRGEGADGGQLCVPDQDPALLQTQVRFSSAAPECGLDPAVRVWRRGLQPAVTIVRLLSSLIQFFSKMRKWADMSNLSQDFRLRMDRLERNFEVSTVIFRKFEPIFMDMFQNPQGSEPPRQPRSRKHRWDAAHL